MEKRKQAVHEDVTLYCHYFNNDKDCPYDDVCIFLHEDSEECKFGNMCERTLCMYKHKSRNGEEIKPVLEKLEEAFEKLSVNLKKHFGPLKCDKCEFEARNKNGLTMHKRAKHTAK